MLGPFLAITAVATSLQFRDVDVPVAPPQIVIEDEEDEETSNRRAERPVPRLRLRLAVEESGRWRKPANARQLVEMLRAALERPYVERLMHSFGYARSERGCCSRGDSSGDLRLRDLYQFLVRTWELHDSTTILGREVDCVSPGEGSLLPLLVLVVQRELMTDRYVIRRGIPRGLQINAAIRASERLLTVCEGRGAPSPRSVVEGGR